MHHRRTAIEKKETHPSYMSLTKNTFHLVSDALRVPASYLYLRANTGGAGSFRRYCQRDDLGNIVNMGKSLLAR